MFDCFAVTVNVVSKDDSDRSDDHAVVRVDECSLELRAPSSDQSEAQSKEGSTLNRLDSNIGRGGKTEALGMGQKVDPKKVLRYKFKNIVGPKADPFKLNQAVRMEPELDTLTTLIAVGRYFPVMLNLKEVASVKGQLAFIINDMQQRSEDQGLLIQTSVFSFNKGELVDLLSAEKTQMLFGFELSYIEEDRETVANLTSKILARCSKKLREQGLNPPSIFFYVTFQVGSSSRCYKYLLCDVYNPFQSTAASPENASLSAELQCLLKYISFETPETEILEQEQTSSLDIFFNELVQEKSQRLGVIVSLPVEKKSLGDTVKLADLALKLEKTSRIFHSYTFRLVQSAVAKVPAILVRRSGDLRESRPESRATSNRKSGAKFGTLDIERPSQDAATKKFEERFNSTFGKPKQPKAATVQESRMRPERPEPETLLEKLETCIQDFEARISNRDQFIEMQSELQHEHLEVTKMKLSTNNAMVEELDRLLAAERYQTDYLKNLIKAISEYKWIKDEPKKAKIIQAINELGGMLGDRVITCLLNLLKEPSNAS